MEQQNRFDRIRELAESEATDDTVTIDAAEVIVLEEAKTRRRHFDPLVYSISRSVLVIEAGLEAFMCVCWAIGFAFGVNLIAGAIKSAAELGAPWLLFIDLPILVGFEAVTVYQIATHALAARTLFRYRPDP